MELKNINIPIKKSKNYSLKKIEPYILPSNNNDLKAFIEKYKSDMTEQVVSSIEFALHEKVPIIEVFGFKNSQFVITISEKDFVINLENIYDFYMKSELYELCPRIIKLKEKLKHKIGEKKQKLSIGRK